MNQTLYKQPLLYHHIKDRKPSKPQPEKTVIKFDDLQIISLLRQSENNLYLAFCPKNNTNYSLKIFPFQNHMVSPHFIKETLLTTISNPNILEVIHTESSMKTLYRGKSITVSYMVMDFAIFGDFGTMFKENKFDHKNEILVRTYFHQIIEGLSCLHSHKIPHLNLAPINLLLGKDYRLKLSFALSGFETGDRESPKSDLENYRAPEIVNGGNSSYESDIYSAGIILFLMKTGHLPYLRQAENNQLDLCGLLETDSKRFWKYHAEKYGSEFDEDFKTLFTSMVNPDPEVRATLNDIKNSKWYNGEVYSEKEARSVICLNL